MAGSRSVDRADQARMPRECCGAARAWRSFVAGQLSAGVCNPKPLNVGITLTAGERIICRPGGIMESSFTGNLFHSLTKYKILSAVT